MIYGRCQRLWRMDVQRYRKRCNLLEVAEVNSEIALGSWRDTRR